VNRLKFFLKPKRKRLLKAARLLAKGRVIAEVVEEAGISFDEALVIYEAVEYLKERFPSKSESWYVRAIYRFLFGVKQLDENRWIVLGLPELGDHYDSYMVVYDKHENKYICDCHFRAYGYVRKAKVCTHIAAVILYRQFKKRIKVIKE